MFCRTFIRDALVFLISTLTENFSKKNAQILLVDIPHFDLCKKLIRRGKKCATLFYDDIHKQNKVKRMNVTRYCITELPGNN